jgi:hypothetical protein
LPDSALSIGGDVKKLESLRQFLAEAIPELKRDADSLLVFANKGSIVSTFTQSRAFVYHYQAECIITDFQGSSDTIMIPLLEWVRINQSELLAPGREDGIKFEAEILSHNTADISITLDLNERVRVEWINGKRVITHLDEPQLPDLSGPTGWSMSAGGELV